MLPVITWPVLSNPCHSALSYTNLLPSKRLCSTVPHNSFTRMFSQWWALYIRTEFVSGSARSNLYSKFCNYYFSDSNWFNHFQNIAPFTGDLSLSNNLPHHKMQVLNESSRKLWIKQHNIRILWFVNSLKTL